MRLIDILLKAGGEVADVRKVLATSGQRIDSLIVEATPYLTPEILARLTALRPEIDRISAVLDLSVSPENIAALAALLPGELLNIGRGQIDPRRHPGDAI